MQISPANAYELHKTRQLAVSAPASPVPPASVKTANQTDPTAISAPRPVNSAEPKMSTGMLHLLLQVQETSTKPSTDLPVLETSKGKVPMDFDKIYANERPKPVGNVKLSDIPFLMPNAENVAALSEHASQKFKQLLANNNIPEAPSSITYDRNGNMQQPQDYPYAQELRQVLKDNPGMERELRDLNAISSHFAELQALQPLHDELGKAETKQQIEQILQKYSHLFDNNRKHKSISLQFAEDGTISVNADNKPLRLV